MRSVPPLLTLLLAAPGCWGEAERPAAGIAPAVDYVEGCA